MKYMYCPNACQYTIIWDKVRHGYLFVFSSLLDGETIERKLYTHLEWFKKF